MIVSNFALRNWFNLFKWQFFKQTKKYHPFFCASKIIHLDLKFDYDLIIYLFYFSVEENSRKHYYPKNYAIVLMCAAPESYHLLKFKTITFLYVCVVMILKINGGNRCRILSTLRKHFRNRIDRKQKLQYFSWWKRNIEVA